MTQIEKLKSPMVSMPRFLGVSDEKCIQLVGLRQHIVGFPYQAIPGFWEQFSPYRGWIPGQIDRTIYGALLKADDGSDGFDYFTAVEVSDFCKVSSDWDVIEIPRQRYSMFLHPGHVSELRETQHAIFAQCLPALNLSPCLHDRSVPLSLERYDYTYDLKTGWGGIQVWIPVEGCENTSAPFRPLEA